jgi:holo-[acyl-carrier protein] synthase
MLQRHGDRFLGHVFTEHEIAYSSTRKRSAEHFTGRWAAKEAALKALGTGWIAGISWKDVEVVNEFSGKPVLKLTGGAEKIARDKGIDEILITISHCQAYAVAYAVAVRK